MAETLADRIANRVEFYVEALNNSSSDYHRFSTVKGKRYLKVVDTRPGGPVGGGSVHAFIEIVSGDVYKPAGWAAPAKHVRYRLMDDASYELIMREASKPSAFCGGYLYL
jgi:hypothetical protein